MKWLKFILPGLLVVAIFSCEEEEPCSPSIVTQEVTTITDSSAYTGISYDCTGGPFGVCWSKQANPTILDNSTWASFGSDDNPRSVKLNGLDGGTNYYVRAFKADDTDTIYGQELMFSTTGTNQNMCGADDIVYDIDGNRYNTVTIGDQCWFRENLRVTRYINGDPIIFGLTGQEWQDTTAGAFAYASHDNSDLRVGLFGVLYNWYAVFDQRRICPDGWHIPTRFEWNQLTEYLGSGTEAEYSMRSYGGYGWDGDIDRLNSSGFSGLPSGIINPVGTFDGNYSVGRYWSSTIDDPWNKTAWSVPLGTGYTQIDESSVLMTFGASCRCVKD